MPLTRDEQKMLREKTAIIKAKIDQGPIALREWLKEDFENVIDFQICMFAEIAVSSQISVIDVSDLISSLREKNNGN